MFGRYLTTDPVGFLGGINLYAYANNNPINSIDSNGHNPAILIGVVAGATTGFLSGIETNILTGVVAGFLGGIAGGLTGAVLAPHMSVPLAGAIAGGVASFYGRYAATAMNDTDSCFKDQAIEGLKAVPGGMVAGGIGGFVVKGMLFLETGALAAESAGAIIVAPINWGNDVLMP